jgi:hypothetical protein
MHSRLRTHGGNNYVNCHPYEVLNIDKGDKIDLYMMHNGIIHKAPNIDKAMSDTWNFIEGIIKPLAKANIDLLWSEEFREMISSYIGTGNKLLFMRSDDVENPVIIINKFQGDIIGGCWLSNLYSTGDTRFPVTHNSYYGRHGYAGGNSHTEDDITDWFDNPRYTTSTGCKVITYKPTSKEIAKVLDHRITDYIADDTQQWDENDLTNTTSSVTITDNYDHLEMTLGALKQMPDDDMIAFMQQEPQEVITIIQHFYTKTNISSDDLLNEIADDNKVKNTVNLIRNLSVKDRLVA